MWSFYQWKHITQHENHHFQKTDPQFKHFYKSIYIEVKENNAILDHLIVIEHLKWHKLLEIGHNNQILMEKAFSNVYYFVV